MLRGSIRVLNNHRGVKLRVVDALICEDEILLDVKDTGAGRRSLKRIMKKT